MQLFPFSAKINTLVLSYDFKNWTKARAAISKLLEVVYIDDELELCELFGELFSSELVHVTTFTDPDAAIQHCKTHNIDVFFLDWRMPTTDGDQLAQVLPKEPPKYLVTGEAYVATEYQFLGLLPKPYDQELVQKILTNLLNEKKD